MLQKNTKKNMAEEEFSRLNVKSYKVSTIQKIMIRVRAIRAIMVMVRVRVRSIRAIRVNPNPNSPNSPKPSPIPITIIFRTYRVQASLFTTGPESIKMANHVFGRLYRI